MLKDYCKPYIYFYNYEKKNGLTIFSIVLIVFIGEQNFKGPYYDISDNLLSPLPLRLM